MEQPGLKFHIYTNDRHEKLRHLQKRKFGSEKEDELSITELKMIKLRFFK